MLLFDISFPLAFLLIVAEPADKEFLAVKTLQGTSRLIMLAP
jgi:hypothetical protein